MRLQLLRLLATSLLGCIAAGSAMAEELFEIRQIRVTGNTLLAEDAVDRLTRPFVGKDKGFRDIQMALEALEGAYRQAGYTAVQVITPEQELTGGTLLLEVRETPIGRITISGNRHYDDANIRATLPSLREGKTPNARELSENIQLANENPAKQIDVVLAVSPSDPAKLDATINVEDERPLRMFVNADNSGGYVTGRHRLGVALRHSNLWGRDHTATFAYTTSPDKPDDTEIHIYSLGYRIPLYGIGDSIDLFLAKSDIDVPGSALYPGLPKASVDQFVGEQALFGKGDLYGIRWNHYFQRQGAWSSKLVAGLDVKSMSTTCRGRNGEKNSDKGKTPNCTPYTTRPFSLTYGGNWQRPGQAFDFNVGAVYNIGTGRTHEYSTEDKRTGEDRYSMISSNRATRDDFTILRLGGSYSHLLPDNWMARIAGTAQSSLGYPLPPAEQIGLSGAQTVRGFHERIVAADSGYIVNAELYAPDVAPMLTLPGNLRPLIFIDTARGYSYRMSGRETGTTETDPSGIMSAGLGLRYNYRKDVLVRFDVASVITAGPAEKLEDKTKAYNGDWRGHFNIVVGF